MVGPGRTFPTGSTTGGGSVDGNGPHDPFVTGSATFLLLIPGVTADTTVTGATFRFGTDANAGFEDGDCTVGCTPVITLTTLRRFPRPPASCFSGRASWAWQEPDSGDDRRPPGSPAFAYPCEGCRSSADRAALRTVAAIAARGTDGRLPPHGYWRSARTCNWFGPTSSCGSGARVRRPAHRVRHRPPSRAARPPKDPARRARAHRRRSL